MRLFLLLGIAAIFSFYSSVAQGIRLPEKENKSSFYAHQKGSIVLHVNNQMFSGAKVSSMPLVVSGEMTWLKNFTAGPLFGYFRFIESKKIAKNITGIENSNVKYHQIFFGVRANYHLTETLEKIIKKNVGKDYFDLYVGVWGGHSWAFSNSSQAKSSVADNNEKFRAGLIIGVRSMVTKRFGLFMEAGPSSFGKASFGMSLKLK